MKTCCWLAGSLLFLCATGCHSEPPGIAPSPPATNPVAVTNTAASLPRWSPTNAQPRLPVMKLLVGPQIVDAELALKPEQLMTGMMWRKEMGENEGMLFVLPSPQQASFYMRNTLLPLHVAYIDPRGTILELHELKPLDETPAPSQAENIQFVLEMNKGWFTRNNVATGTVIRTEVGGLKDAFRFGQ
jgi:uncharacterized membrane protein (UPF0127 family)